MSKETNINELIKSKNPKFSIVSGVTIENVIVEEPYYILYGTRINE